MWRKIVFGYVLIFSFFCCDFPNKSNGLFVIGVVFTRQISTFELAIFDGVFLHHSKSIVGVSLTLKNYFPSDYFL